MNEKQGGVGNDGLKGQREVDGEKERKWIEIYIDRKRDRGKLRDMDGERGKEKLVELKKNKDKEYKE